MAGKTLINGTAYTIKGGKTKVNGTAYSIKKGITKINGTARTISFWDPSAHKRVGGRIFYDNGGSNTYTFYTQDGTVITDLSISGLANAYYYDKSGNGADRFYVYDNTTHTTGGKTANNGLVNELQWGYYQITIGETTNSIGSGKTNTATILSTPDTSIYSDSIFRYVNACNTANLNGCNDWFIASQAEQDRLRDTGLVTWYNNKYIWSSVYRFYSNSWFWYSDYYSWSSAGTGSRYCAFAARAF